jgi:hypothetical protein
MNEMNRKREEISTVVISARYKQFFIFPTLSENIENIGVFYMLKLLIIYLIMIIATKEKTKKATGNDIEKGTGRKLFTILFINLNHFCNFKLLNSPSDAPSIFVFKNDYMII